MLSLFLHIYLIGAAAMALLLAVAYFGSLPSARREYPEIFSLVREVAAEYILFWPWRVVGFPILCYIRFRRETLDKPW